jgi:hypothetical protein
MSNTTPRNTGFLVRSSPDDGHDLAGNGADGSATGRPPAPQHNPVIAAQYVRKRAAGKSPMNALGHCMRKALSIVWGVWRNGQDFDPKWGLEA